MNIIRNIYCEGVFEGSYILKCKEEQYIWIIMEENEKHQRLNVERGRTKNIYENDEYSRYHYGRTIPFKEIDLNGDF